jgi:hypothetical protein
VTTPVSDRNGGYQHNPQGYGTHPGYQPPVPYQQSSNYTLEQQQRTYPPQQSTHGMFSVN